MLAENVQLAAVVLTGIWISSALLELSGTRRAAPFLNAAVSAVAGGAALPAIGAALINRDEYVSRYGYVALQQLPLAVAVLSLSLVGICVSLAAVWRGLGAFVIGWFANAPMVAFALYLAFWFRLY